KVPSISGRVVKRLGLMLLPMPVPLGRRLLPPAPEGGCRPFNNLPRGPRRAGDSYFPGAGAEEILRRRGLPRAVPVAAASISRRKAAGGGATARCANARRHTFRWRLALRESWAGGVHHLRPRVVHARGLVHLGHEVVLAIVPAPTAGAVEIVEV